MILETSHSIQDILARQPLFKGLNAVEISALARGTREYRVHRNELLFQKGDLPEGLHIVILGQVKLSIPSPQGSEKVVHMAGPGTSFGEAVVFLDRPYPVSALATQDSIVLMVGKETLLGAINHSPTLARKMLASLSMRLHELIDDMETCTMRTSLQRVVCYLSHQAPGDASSGYSIALSTSKQTVASQLNLAPETFSRALTQLSEAGLIRVKGRNIAVLDRERLLAYPG
jgi:CRP-like cAMP-binding protein